MIVAAIRSALLAGSAVSALVGARVYPRYLPQHPTFPACVLHLIGGVSDQSSTGPTGPIERRLQVDCWGERYADADALATAVRQRLNGLRGTFNQATFGPLRCVHEGDLGEVADMAIDQGPGLPLAGRRLDFMLWHME